ncbi:MAG: hypothetical protein LYZ69_06690 [Nitrososphaerales archaeon]|nr:hypothetical protein [Nitrososphaerales archaeon]
MRLGYYVSMGKDPYALATQPINGLSIPGTGILPSIGYPPLWALIQAAVYRLYLLIGVDNRFLYYFLIKQETIIGDLVAAFLLYKIIRLRSSEGDATAAFAFWMLCPITIVLSSIWGIFDQLTLALVLFSLLALSSTTRSSLSEGMGVLLKGIPLIFLPGLAAGQKSTSRRLAYLSIAVIVAVTLSLAPYLVFQNWSLARLFATGFSTVNKISNSANFWVIAYVWSQFLPISPSVALAMTWFGYAWIVGILAGYAFCLLGVGRDRINQQYLVIVLLFSTLIFYLTRISINEQYVVYFLGLGLIDRYWNGPKRWRLFNGLWLTVFVFFVFNNIYFTRFLSPLSVYYTYLNNTLTSGLSGDVRYGAMIACGLAFTSFCLLYLRSLYSEIRAYKGQRALKA